MENEKIKININVFRNQSEELRWIVPLICDGSPGQSAFLDTSITNWIHWRTLFTCALSANGLWRKLWHRSKISILLSVPRDDAVKLRWKIHLTVLFSIAKKKKNNTSVLILANWSLGDNIRKVEQNLFYCFMYII